MPGLGKDEARLASLDPEAVRERGVVIPPVRRVGVDLGVQGLQLIGVRGDLRPVEQPEGQIGRQRKLTSNPRRPALS